MIFFAAPLATIIEQAPLDIREGFRSKCGKASAKAILGISLFLPSPLSLWPSSRPHSDKWSGAELIKRGGMEGRGRGDEKRGAA